MPLPTVAPTERVFSPQTVCVWATGLYLARWHNPAIPVTKEEVIALAAASGVADWHNVGRANFTKLAVGMKLRYGLVVKVIEGAAAAQSAVLAAASAGPCAIGLAGDQLNLTPHWQPVSVGHAIAVFYQGGTAGIQLDPLAPQGYAGDPFPPAEMSKFTTAAIIVAGAPKEVDVANVLRPVRQEWTTGVGDPGGVFWTGGPGLGTRKQFNAPTRVTTIAESVDAAGLSGSWRIVLFGPELLWMARANLTPLANTRVPASGFGLEFGDAAALARAQADRDAAVARIAAIKAKVAAGAVDIADD